MLTNDIRTRHNIDILYKYLKKFINDINKKLNIYYII